MRRRTMLFFLVLMMVGLVPSVASAAVRSRRIPEDIFVRGIDVVGDKAYLAASLDGLIIVDIDGGRLAAAETGSIDPGTVAHNVEVVGTTAYLGDEKGLYVIDVSNPAAPTLVREVGGLGHVHASRVIGDRLYVAAGGLFIYDIRDRHDPQVVGAFRISDFRDFDKEVWDFAIGNDGFAYLGLNDGLMALDIRDETNPTLHTQLTTYYLNSSLPSTFFGVDIVGDLIYLASSSDGLLIVQRNGANWDVVGRYETIGVPHDVIVRGKFAYLADSSDGSGRNGLHIVDVSNSKYPILEAYKPTDGYARELAIANGVIYMADNDDVFIFDTADLYQTSTTGCEIPPSGPWPPCATDGNPQSSSNDSGDCVIPSSGPWPPCATGGNSPSSNNNNSGDCEIPLSGPWPACATGGNPQPPRYSNGCVIPPSGAWPACAR